MAWQTEMVRLVRVMLADMSDPPLYADGRLQELLVATSQLVINELTFSRAYTPDLGSLTISPDPCDRVAGTRDDSYVNLICLKACCILERGEVRSAASQAISIRDGTSAIDLRGAMEGKLKLLDKGWCAVYEDAKLEYQMGQVRVAGACIMGPFRVFAGYSDVGYYPSQTDRAAYFR